MRHEGPPLVRHERGRGAVGRAYVLPPPSARARRGAELAVEYLGGATVSVAIVGSTPLFDPESSAPSRPAHTDHGPSAC